MFSRTCLTKKYRFEIVCLLPLLIFLFLFTLVPLVRVIALSFQPCDGRALTLSHYRELTAQPAFKLAFVNTVVIAGVSLFLEVVFGLGLALLLVKNDAAGSRGEGGKWRTLIMSGNSAGKRRN